jgi:hypothetical protein
MLTLPFFFRLWDIIEQFESAARVTLKAHDGATELIAFLKLHQVRVGLFTRNSSHGILAMKQMTGLEFDYELSRDFHPPKPGTNLGTAEPTVRPFGLETNRCGLH